MKKKILITTLLILAIIFLIKFFSNNHTYIVLNQEVNNCNICLVKNEEMAIKLAEENLFKIYGKSKIESERPYNIKLINNKIWHITGSLNQNILEKIINGNMPKFGGGFEIEINAENGKVLKLVHYK